MRSKTLQFLPVIVLVVFVAGCGGQDTPAPQSPGTSPNGAVETAPLGNATITGTIHFEGTPPERVQIRQSRECEEIHGERILAENVVVNDNGTLKWAFVYVKEGLGDHSFAVPAEPVILDQEDCMYTPHVVGMQANQTLKILNSDPLLHNIHAMPETNRPFNFGMPRQGTERDQTFRIPEVMVRIKCDVHPWMSAYVGVLEHPYFSVTGDDGTFSIGNLPAGEYVIEVWQEEYGATTQTVTVGEGDTVTADFTYTTGGPSV